MPTSFSNVAVPWESDSDASYHFHAQREEESLKHISWILLANTQNTCYQPKTLYQHPSYLEGVSEDTKLFRSQMANSHSHKLQWGEFWLDTRKKLFSVKMSKLWKRGQKGYQLSVLGDFQLVKDWAASFSFMHSLALRRRLTTWKVECNLFTCFKETTQTASNTRTVLPSSICRTLWDESSHVMTEHELCRRVHFHTALQTKQASAELGYHWPLLTQHLTPPWWNCVLQGLDFTSINLQENKKHSRETQRGELADLMPPMWILICIERCFIPDPSTWIFLWEGSSYFCGSLSLTTTKNSQRFPRNH